MEEPPDTSGNDMDAEWDKSDNLKIDIEDGDVIGVRNVDSEGEITAEDARGGRDIQGIPWERIYFTREGCREHRLKQYKNYKNLEVPEYAQRALDAQCLRVDSRARFYDFFSNTRQVRSYIVHFQLRNLLWATSNHDVYFNDDHSVSHWDPVSGRVSEVLDLHSASHMSPTDISTICVERGGGLLAVGGFRGELFVKRLGEAGLVHCARIAPGDNAITNSIDIAGMGGGGGARIMCGNNDARLRTFDAETFAALGDFEFPWAVNYATASPDGKVACVVGDNPSGLLADARDGKVLARLEGHLDYSFAAAWHPGGVELATGNQDATTRIWDIRRLDEAVHVIKGRMGAVRSLRYSADGAFLAMAEPADFVHILAARAGYAQSQEVDMFGEVSGVAFSPEDPDSLFVAVADQTYNSLLQFDRHVERPDLDYLF